MSRQRPIRLGGRAVQPLEFEPCAVDPEANAFDPIGALKALGFGRTELAFLEQRINGVPVSRIGQQLRWAPSKTERVRKRIERRLKCPETRNISLLFLGACRQFSV